MKTSLTKGCFTLTGCEYMTRQTFEVSCALSWIMNMQSAWNLQTRGYCALLGSLRTGMLLQRGTSRRHIELIGYQKFGEDLVAFEEVFIPEDDEGISAPEPILASDTTDSQDLESRSSALKSCHHTQIHHLILKGFRVGGEQARNCGGLFRELCELVRATGPVMCKFILGNSGSLSKARANPCTTSWLRKIVPGAQSPSRLCRSGSGQCGTGNRFH